MKGDQIEKIKDLIKLENSVLSRIISELDAEQSNNLEMASHAKAGSKVGATHMRTSGSSSTRNHTKHAKTMSEDNLLKD